MMKEPHRPHSHMYVATTLNMGDMEDAPPAISALREQHILSLTVYGRGGAPRAIYAWKQRVFWKMCRHNLHPKICHPLVSASILPGTLTDREDLKAALL